MDIDALFGQAKTAVETGMNDLLKQGGNAALGWLEDKAISVIDQDKAQREAQLKQYVQQNISGPPSPGSFGAYIANLAQSPVLKEFGPSILIGIAIVAGGTILLTRRG